MAGGGNDFSMMDGDKVVGTCVVMGWGDMEWWKWVMAWWWVALWGYDV